METPLHYYRIQDLVLLPELNPRAELCEETITRYMESFDSLPPISIQEGSGVLVDGFHRVEAATRLGVESVPVQMLDIADEELPLYAGLANCAHGRALSRAERNRFVVRLVEEFGWAIEKAARTVGVSASSVHLAVREHRYNRELSERLGEDVQVINSSHVQALYRVGDEQRARLLDAVASKTDDAGRPRPLTGSELKLLVDRLEDPDTPAEELHRLLDDPTVRPEAPARRRAARDTDQTSGPSEVERRGPLHSGGAADAALRDELLSRAFASDDGEPANGTRKSDRESSPWQEDCEELLDTAERPAPLGLGSPHGWGSAPERAEAAVAVRERGNDERTPADALREAEQTLCDLCARLEDAELWELARAARDLVREALQA